MAASKKLIKYLDKGGIKYEIVPHKKVYTAYDLAQTLGEKLDGIAKTLLVKVELPKVSKEGKYFVLVIPASYRANLKKIQKSLKATAAKLAPEKVMKKLAIEPGALTPFGGYHKIEVLLDKALLKTEKVLVNAESYTEALRVKVKDLHQKEHATVGSFGDKAKLKLQVAVKKAKKLVRKAAKKTKKAVKKAKKAVKKARR